MGGWWSVRGQGEEMGRAGEKLQGRWNGGGVGCGGGGIERPRGLRSSPVVVLETGLGLQTTLEGSHLPLGGVFAGSRLALGLDGLWIETQPMLTLT